MFKKLKVKKQSPQDQKLNEIVTHYGNEQLLKTLEELTELQIAISEMLMYSLSSSGIPSEMTTAELLDIVRQKSKSQLSLVKDVERRGLPKSLKIKPTYNLLEEIADVKIMTKQLEILFNVENDVTKIQEEKIQRQLKRIKQECEKNATGSS